MSLKHTQLERLSAYHLWGKGQIGDYIDRGGFGRVYDLHGLHEDGTVDALKIVTIEYTKEAEEKGEDKQKYLLNGLRGTLDEVHRMMELEKLEHFVSIYGYEDYPIREDGELVGYDILIWMEKLTVLTKYIEQRQKKNIPVTERDFLQIGMDVCAGLQEANRLVQQREKRYAEFIHRDIKPENIFVSTDGCYKLGDLGIATMNQNTLYSNVGTPFYMAPEMFAERGYHASVDLFALGRTLERLTSGYELQSGLLQVICRAEALHPEDRYQSAQQMLADLQLCVHHLEHPKELTDKPYLGEKPRSIYPWNEHTEKITQKMTVQPPGRTRKAENAQGYPVGQVSEKNESSGKFWQQDLAQERKRKGRLAVSIVIIVLVASGCLGGRLYWQHMQTEEQIAELKQTVSACAEEQDYVGAIEALREQSALLEKETSLSELLTEYEDSFRDSILKEAGAAFYADDLQKALAVINHGLDILENDKQLENYQKDYQDDYRESVIKQAEEVYKEEDNQAALKVIMQGLTVLTDDTELLKYRELCKNCDPVPLYDQHYINQTITDSEGNSYQGYFKLPCKSGEASLYPFNGTYETFCVDFFTQPDYKGGGSSRFIILASEGRILYDSGYFDKNTGTISVSLDVSGLDGIYIETKGSALLFSNPDIIVANAVLKKPFELDES